MSKACKLDTIDPQITTLKWTIYIILIYGTQCGENRTYQNKLRTCSCWKTMKIIFHENAHFILGMLQKAKLYGEIFKPFFC
jgi:hypothetical protein